MVGFPCPETKTLIITSKGNAISKMWHCGVQLVMRVHACVCACMRVCVHRACVRVENGQRKKALSPSFGTSDLPFLLTQERDGAV